MDRTMQKARFSGKGHKNVVIEGLLHMEAKS